MSKNFYKDAFEVLPNVWIGNKKPAMSKHFLKKIKINYIIDISESKSITENFLQKINNIQYFDIMIKDNMCNNINILFDKSADFIMNGLQIGKVLICSTVLMDGLFIYSGSLVVAFIMKYLKINYLDAISYVNSIIKFPISNSNCFAHALFGYSIHLKRNNIQGGGINNANKNECDCIACLNKYVF